MEKELVKYWKPFEVGLDICALAFTFEASYLYTTIYTTFTTINRTLCLL